MAVGHSSHWLWPVNYTCNMLHVYLRSHTIRQTDWQDGQTHFNQENVVVAVVAVVDFLQWSKWKKHNQHSLSLSLSPFVFHSLTRYLVLGIALNLSLSFISFIFWLNNIVTCRVPRSIINGIFPLLSRSTCLMGSRNGPCNGLDMCCYVCVCVCVCLEADRTTWQGKKNVRRTWVSLKGL